MDTAMAIKRLGLLIATTGYVDQQLPGVPDGAAHLNDLAKVLQSPKIGGFALARTVCHGRKNGSGPGVRFFRTTAFGRDSLELARGRGAGAVAAL